LAAHAHRGNIRLDIGLVGFRGEQGLSTGPAILEPNDACAVTTVSKVRSPPDSTARIVSPGRMAFRAISEPTAWS
jgi:hypothetical protein